jgi:hypothetical protein
MKRLIRLAMTLAAALLLVCSMPASTYRRVPLNVEVSKKSQASRASVCDRRKADQTVLVRWGAGSIPVFLRICQTVEAATVMRRTRRSPWIRR